MAQSQPHAGVEASLFAGDDDSVSWNKTHVDSGGAEHLGPSRAAEFADAKSTLRIDAASERRTLVSRSGVRLFEQAKIENGHSGDEPELPCKEGSAERDGQTRAAFDVEHPDAGSEIASTAVDVLWHQQLPLGAL